MKLYSYKFPIQLENEDRENFEFKPPYEITTALHIENSHYVGYTLKDCNGSSVCVFDILSLKEYIKYNPIEFKNASICKISGQLNIVDFENIPHEESLEYKTSYERRGINQSILHLLEINDKVLMPRKIFSFSVNEKNKISKCKLTREFKAFIKKFNKQYMDDALVIPRPLSISENGLEFDASNLFENIDFSGIKVDFSLLDLRCFKNVSKIFSKVNIDNLKVSTFNLNPTKLTSAFERITCGTLDLSNCDFSNVSNVESLLVSSKIRKLKATNCKMPYNFNSYRGYYHKNINDYLCASIDEFDLNIFSNISEENFNRNLSNSFYGLTCKKFNNIEKLPIRNAKSLSNIFNGLNIDELDLRNFPAFSLENCTKLFANLKCDNLILDYKIFDNVDKANELFLKSKIGCDLDFSNANFKKLSFDGANRMFAKIEIDGTLIPPTNYGTVEDFSGFFYNAKINQLILKNINFSKATTMEKFLYKSKIKTGITFPKNKKLIPKNLENINLIFNQMSTPFLDLSNWNFENVDVSSFENLYSYNKKTGCVIEKTGNAVLGVDIASFMIPSNNAFSELLSKNKTWNYYYDCFDNGEIVSFIRDTDLIENKF